MEEKGNEGEEEKRDGGCWESRSETKGGSALRRLGIKDVDILGF